MLFKYEQMKTVTFKLCWKTISTFFNFSVFNVYYFWVKFLSKQLTLCVQVSAAYNKKFSLELTKPTFHKELYVHDLDKKKFMCLALTIH